MSSPSRSRDTMKSMMTAACCGLFLSTLLACNGDSDGGAGMSGAATCLPPLDLECDHTYGPTFDQFFERRIEDTCGSGGSLCHGPSGNKGNLTLDPDDPDAAYNALLDPDHGLVIPGDPECSMLIKRLESEDPDFVMPVRQPLMPGELCAIRKWVANGAERR
jgi:hypothetical protein